MVCLQAYSIKTFPIALSEVQAMSASLKQGKAVSVDKLPNEVLKNETPVKLLHALYTNCFSSGIIPDEWLNSLIYITPIFKGKGKDPKVNDQSHLHATLVRVLAI